jgi:hypothetical protein
MRIHLSVAALVGTVLGVLTACGSASTSSNEDSAAAGSNDAPPSNGTSTVVYNNLWPSATTGAYSSFSQVSDAALIFTATTAAKTISGKLNLYRSSTTTDTATYDVKLHSVVSGKPSTALVTLISAGKFSALGTTPNSFVSFSKSATLTSGSSYAVVVTRSASSLTGRWSQSTAASTSYDASSTSSVATKASSSATSWTTGAFSLGAQITLSL